MGRAFNSNGQPIAPTGTGRVGRADFEAYRQRRAVEQQKKAQQNLKTQVLDVSKLPAQVAYNQIIAANKAGMLSRYELQAKLDEISQREQNKIKSNFQKSITPIEVAKSTAGAIGRGVVGAGGALVGALTSAYDRLGKGYGEVIGEATGVSGRARQTQLQSQQMAANTIKGLSDILRSPNASAEQKARARQAIQNISKTSLATSTEFTKRQAEIAERTDPLKGLAAVGEVGLDVLTAGTLPAIKGAIKVGKGLSTAQKVAKVAKPIAGGAGIGGLYGALSEVEQKGAKATPGGIAKSAGVGILTGGGLVGAGIAIPKLAKKALATKTGKEVSQKVLASKPSQYLFGDKTAVQKAVAKAKAPKVVETPKVEPTVAEKPITPPKKIEVTTPQVTKTEPKPKGSLKPIKATSDFKNVESLKQEALKYKSADEFVKSQGDPLYHGSQDNISRFDLNHLNSTYMHNGLGINFTPDKKFAQLYARGKNQWGEINKFDNGNGTVNERYITQSKVLDLTKSNTRVGDVLSLKQFEDIAKNGADKKFARDNLERYARNKLSFTMKGDSRDWTRAASEMSDSQLLKMAYDGMRNKPLTSGEGLPDMFRQLIDVTGLKNSDSASVVKQFSRLTGADYIKSIKKDGSVVYTVLNPEKLKTKQQLIDLYNQAHAQPTPQVTNTPVGEQRVTGGAKKLEAQTGVKLEDPATYDETSYKTNKITSDEFVDNNKEGAFKALEDKTLGDAQRQETYKSLSRKVQEEFKKTGNMDDVQRLGRLSTTEEQSKAAQILGQSGYLADPKDPFKIINDVKKAKEKAVSGRVKGKITEKVKRDAVSIKSNIKSPTKQDWASFIDELRCK